MYLIAGQDEHLIIDDMRSCTKGVFRSISTGFHADPIPTSSAHMDDILGKLGTGHLVGDLVMAAPDDDAVPPGDRHMTQRREGVRREGVLGQLYAEWPHFAL